VFSHKLIASWVEQGRKTPGISKGDEVRLARKELSIESFELNDMVSGHRRPIETRTQLRTYHCVNKDFESVLPCCDVR